MKKSYEEFIQMVKSECKKYGVKLDLRKGKYIRLMGFRCGGCFEDTPPTLTVAMGHKESKALFAHEYCHLTQWADGIQLWSQCAESLSILEGWLKGEEVNDIEKHIAICRSLELDNEMRTSKIIEEYDLDIDLDLYIKKSNAYVLFYNWLLESRRWSKPGNSPYVNPRVLEVMSNKFDMNYETLDPEISRIFKQENI
jgi:hypothetical protein